MAVGWLLLFLPPNKIKRGLKRGLQMEKMLSTLFINDCAIQSHTIYLCGAVVSINPCLILLHTTFDRMSLREKNKILCAFKATVLFFLSIQYSTLLYQLNNITFLLRTILILLLYFNFTLAKFDFVHQLKKRRGIKSTVDVIEYNAKWDSNISLVEGRNIWHHLT